MQANVLFDFMINVESAQHGT